MLGSTEHGVFTANPQYARLVGDTVRAYGFARFNAERSRRLQNVRFLLARALAETTRSELTRAPLHRQLDRSVAWLGPVRAYLLRPPT